MKIVAYVPMKLNNERLSNKNTRSFDNGRPLLTYILDTLCQTKGLSDVYAYCSNETIKQYLPDQVKYLTRSILLDRSETKINEVMLSFAQDVEADIYVLAHATAPFISAASIEDGISKIVNEGYDSALAVTKLQDFLWKDGKPFNYNPEFVPRTQDLPPMYTETTGLYIYTRELIINHHRRIGERPYLIPVSKIEAIDINEPLDFEIANAVFNKTVRLKSAPIDVGMN
jgi:CMP-N-acetylneuraminic acid synthetase